MTRDYVKFFYHDKLFKVMTICYSYPLVVPGVIERLGDSKQQVY